MMLLKIWFQMYVLVSMTMCFLVQNDVQILESQLAECMASLAERHFAQEKLVFLQFPELWVCRHYDLNYVDSLLQVLVNKMSREMMILGCVEDEQEVENFKSGVLIIVVKEFNQMEIYRQFAKVSVQHAVNTYILYELRIVIISTLVPETLEQQQEISLSLISGAWVYWIKTEIIVLTPEVGWSSSKNKTPAIDIYGWNPTEQEDPCFREINQASFLDRWISAEKGFLRNEGLFTYKGFEYDRTCTIDIKLYRLYPYVRASPSDKIHASTNEMGIYPILWDIITKKINVKFEYHEEDSDNIADYDIEGPVLMRITDFDGNYILTYPYFIDVIWYYVPVIRVARWQGLIRVFSGFVWLFVAITFLLGMMILWVLEKYLHNKNVSIIDSFLNTLRTYIAVGIPFDCKGILSTSFFILWLFYCMQLYTAYTSLLTSFLAYPGEYPLVSSIEELKESSYEIWTNIQFIDSINEIEELFLTYSLCTASDCIDKLIREQDVLVIGNIELEQAITLLLGYTSSSERTSISKMDNSLIDYYVTLVMKSVILLDYFDKQMHKLVSSGIPYFYLHKLDIEKQFYMSYSNGPKPTTLSELQGPFYFLMGGLATGLIAFIVEKVYFRKKRILL
ncbi:Ionotropic receptor 559 [Blattella germanica]|nr:Ionotropic receptor 559 [Blattella germanica]